MRRIIGAVAIAGLVMSVMASPSLAATQMKKTVKNANGQSLTVSNTTLSASGSTVRVSGKGFSRTTGVYVALCVVVPRGQQPTPCGGGINIDGKKPSSAWISSNPPPYGQKLAIPYKKGGRFSVSLSIGPKIGSVDCRTTKCAIYTRADHLSSSNRKYDVAVPVTFK